MTPYPMRNPRVLVVDPDREVLEVFTTVLGRDGWVLLATDSADVAFRIARTAGPALILGEHPLYRAGGGRLCEDLRSDPVTAGIPFIAITSPADRRALEDAWHGHPAGVVAKPVRPGDLLELVRARVSAGPRARGPLLPRGHLPPYPTGRLTFPEPSRAHGTASTRGPRTRS